MKRYYVTTAIDYVNSKPHLGHSYEKVAADVLARFLRLKGYEVRLQVGVDEHSINVARKAVELGLETKEYCDQMVELYREFFEILNVDYQRLIRTSDQDHQKVVQEVIIELAKKGYIYPHKYEGWYCPSCEAFYRDRDLVDGCCPVHDFLRPEWVQEYNYYFRLSMFQEDLLTLFNTNPDWLEPVSRKNEIFRRLEDGLEDISISRAVSDWGIRVPLEVLDYIDFEDSDLTKNSLVELLKDQRVYVWFDALLNYITGAGYRSQEFSDWWPASVELIGKDITWFHSVIQPALLLALELPLPKKIFAHGFMTLDGKKISSSRGNLIYPEEIIEKAGLDPFRYYLFRRVSFGLDGDFCWKDYYETYNASLANALGNLVYRSLKMVGKYYSGIIPEPGEPTEYEVSLLRDALDTVCRTEELFANLEISQALFKIEEFIRRTNRYIDETLPWTIKDGERLGTVLYYLLDAIRLGAILLSPYIPDTSGEILLRLGCATPITWPEIEDGRFKDSLTAGVQTQIGDPLYPRIEYNIS